MFDNCLCNTPSLWRAPDPQPALPMLAHPFGPGRRIRNPMTGLDDLAVAQVRPGTTPLAILAHYRPQTSGPLMLLVNGRPVLRRWWGTPLPTGADAVFVQLPRGGGDSNALQILASIAVLAAAALAPYAFGLAGTWAGSLISAGILAGGTLLVSLVFPARKQASAVTSNDLDITMYSLAPGGNRPRLGQPYPERFGTTKYYPDLLQSGFVNIDGATQNQIFYGLYMLGRGEHLVENVTIDDTPIQDYAGTSHRIIRPGQSPTMIPRVVWTCEEVSGQELKWNEYLTVTVNPSGTAVAEIEWDITMPAGLWQLVAGLKWFASAIADVHVRLVDNSGSPLTDWTQVWTFAWTLAYPEPLRWSYKISPPWGPGRYQFRIKRGSEEFLQPDAVDDVIISGLRGYGPPHRTYEDCTLLEVSIMATNQLSNNVADKVRVKSTRLLPVVTATGLTTPYQPTRSIVDAVAYMVCAPNMGGLPQGILDYALLAEAKAAMATAGHWFDYAVTSQTDLLELVSLAAEAGLAAPAMPGGKLALVLDEWSDEAIQLTEDDYDKDSFKVSYLPRNGTSPTCVYAKYLDPVTWTEKTVICLDENGSEERPRKSPSTAVPAGNRPTRWACGGTTKTGTTAIPWNSPLA
ncbi:hypothetical protein [Megalodesulfovibrio gigas]|uniref:hypothetical protein n=1 Tax=Megalodesulfovibrio gigas TaxID=879 RepID=UPI000484C831|nr:hypothetical protein [Megalodesulfovibrio gigas]